MGTVAETFWKALLAKLDCVVCRRYVPTGVRPSLHHIASGSGLRSVFSMAPICEPHHQGPRGFHSAPKGFILMYRPPGDCEYGMLVWVCEDLAIYLRGLVPLLGRR